MREAATVLECSRKRDGMAAPGHPPWTVGCADIRLAAHTRILQTILCSLQSLSPPHTLKEAFQRGHKGSAGQKRDKRASRSRGLHTHTAHQGRRRGATARELRREREQSTEQKQTKCLQAVRTLSAAASVPHGDGFDRDSRRDGGEGNERFDRRAARSCASTA